MIELWSKAQIDELLTEDRVNKIKFAASKYPMPNGATLDLDDGLSVQIVEAKSIPPSAIRIVVNIKSLTAAIEYSKTAGTKVEQVFQKTRMVPVVEYVTAKDL